MEIHTRESVWDAVADDPQEAANLKLRSQLMDALESYIGQENITQTEAAKRLGVPRSRVSELIHGRISKFTIDKLVNMASRVGLTTRITVETGRVRLGLPAEPGPERVRASRVSVTSSIRPGPPQHHPGHDAGNEASAGPLVTHHPASRMRRA